MMSDGSGQQRSSEKFDFISRGTNNTSDKGGQKKTKTI